MSTRKNRIKRCLANKTLLLSSSYTALALLISVKRSSFTENSKKSFQELEHRASMAMSGTRTISVHLLLAISLSAISVAAGGRLVHPLRDFEEAGFGGSFRRIYDTSKYGIFQLNNGLARTPQMGQVSFTLWSFLS